MEKNACISGKSEKTCVKKTTFDTDGVLIDVYNALTRDFQRFKNIGTLPFISTVKGARDLNLPNLSDQMDVKTYKAIYQLKSFFSRYTASEDKYSHTDRVKMTEQKYVENLLHINTVRSTCKAYLQPVVGRARKIIREILGELNVEEVFGASRFGRRASIGVPFQEAYLDNKMVPSMSCSHNGAHGLLSDAIVGDPVLQGYLQNLLYSGVKYHNKDLMPDPRKGQKIGSQKVFCTQLRLSFVAKKFDKLRGVMPYPTGDTLLSLGIGDILVSRLKGIGLDLSRLQAVHRRLVKKMSQNRRSVTMDLSGASDSITRWLVRLLLPSKWWKLLKMFYFGTVVLPSGQVVHTETFAGMGCGFTFPLESLIFYALLKAIGELLPVKGRISVYGDDCIFPRPMFPYVERVFEDLGLKINREKTFVTRYFRESCGEDCYRGSSVRPFQPEGTTVKLSGSEGAAHLYKILNGVLNRWEHREIPNTVEVLLRKIALHSGSVLLVPPFQPDTAGFKVMDPDEYVDWYIPVDKPVKHYPKGAKGLPVWLRSKPSYLEPMYMYKALVQRSHRRFVSFVYPYLWEHLRSSQNGSESQWNPYLDVIDDPKILGYAVPPSGGKKKAYVAAKGSGHYIEQAIASQWELVN